MRFHKQNGFRIEISGLLERLFAQEFIDVGQALIQEKSVERRAEHALWSPCDRLGKPFLSHPAQQIFFPQPLQFQIGIDSGQEIEHVVVEERIAHLDRLAHRDPVAFETEQLPGKMNLGGPEGGPVYRVPASGPAEIRLDRCIGIMVVEALEHAGAVEAETRRAEKIVKSLKRMRAAG